MDATAVMRFLRTHHHVVLSTQGSDGWPHAVPITYVMLDGKLAMSSNRRSQKVVNMMQDERVSCLVEDGDTHESRRGVLVFGSAQVVADSALVIEVMEAILATNPLGKAAVPLPLEEMARNRVAILVTPLRCVSWDHARASSSERQVTAVRRST